MVTRPDRGWFWFIPISDTVISVGAVVPQAVYNARAQADAGADARSLSGRDARGRAARRDAPAGDAPRASKPTTRISTAGTPAIGSSLAGDAGAFLDPIFSTGVLLAMQSGIEAAEVISDGLRDGDLSARRFAAYERRLVRRYQHFRRFAVGFYDPAFRDLFFNRSSRFGIYEAVLSVLGGNWRPSLEDSPPAARRSSRSSPFCASRRDSPARAVVPDEVPRNRRTRVIGPRDDRT